MMNKDIKHYLLVGGILCAIGGVSALLIALTNFVTSGPIKEHEKQKEELALKEVFMKDDGSLPTDLVSGDKLSLKEDLDSKYDSLICYWNPKSSEEAEGVDEKYGYVFKAEASDKNNYGSITLLVAINNDYSVGRISIVKNTESYANVVQKDYVDPYNKGDIALDDVTCGATFGATAIKDMVNCASLYAKEVLNNGK